jgi:hypothetical protein
VTPPRSAFLTPSLAALIAVLALAGCQATYQAPPPTPGQLAQEQRRPPPRPPRPPAPRPSQEQPPAEATGVDTPPAATDPSEPPMAPGGAPPSASAPGAAPAPLPPQNGQSAALPQRVTGMRAEDVRQRLGAPQSQRTAGAARVWRYQGRECAVEIYFYYDTGQADFFALEQRLEGQAASPEACLATIPAATRPS